MHRFVKNRSAIISLLIALFCGVAVESPAGEIADSSLAAAQKGAIDTLRLLSDQPVKSPWGAVLRSAILPGWGQVYNEKYLKGALALAINGALLWQVFDYHDQWQSTGQQNYRDKRNLYTWYWGLAYLLTMVDAYVDASLFGFDKAMDIAALPPGPGGFSAGIALRFRF